MYVQSTMETLYRYGGEWTCMYPRITLYGHDSSLLWTRKLVLEKAGLSVRTVIKTEDLGRYANVLVLCFTLSAAEKVAAVRQFRSRFPDARILILGGAPQDLPCDECETLAAYPGPEIFVKQVSRLASEHRSV